MKPVSIPHQIHECSTSALASSTWKPMSAEFRTRKIPKKESNFAKLFLVVQRVHHFFHPPERRQLKRAAWQKGSGRLP